MERIGNLREKDEKAGTNEEKRELIQKAGMKLDKGELDQVTGGGRGFFTCSECGRQFASAEEYKAHLMIEQAGNLR